MEPALAALTAPTSHPEPYADIYGTHPELLLARPRVHCEIFNDITGDIVRAYRRYRANEPPGATERNWPANWHERLKNVQIDCAAPPKLLELVGRQPNATILIAPPPHPEPYPPAEIAELTDTINRIHPSARIIVAGPPHDWQHLAAQPRWKHTATKDDRHHYYHRGDPPTGPPMKAWQINILDPAKRKTALAWLGGKTPFNPGGTGRWLQEIIPADAAIYAEPYAGMLGQLLARPPAPKEIITDLNPRLINWWQQVRDRPSELTALIAATPNARAEWAAAKSKLDHPDPLTRAWAFQIATTQGITKSDSAHVWMLHSFGTHRDSRGESKLRWLAARVANAQIKCQPATDTLAELADAGPGAVIYCDPPYYTSTSINRSYGEAGRMTAKEIAATTEALQAQTGRVIISGVAGEWEHLGWNRLDRPTAGHSLAHLKSISARLECAWLNYDHQPVRPPDRTRR